MPHTTHAKPAPGRHRLTTPARRRWLLVPALSVALLGGGAAITTATASADEPLCTPGEAISRLADRYQGLGGPIGADDPSMPTRNLVTLCVDPANPTPAR